MSNLRPFQIAILAIFAVLAVVGILLLKGFTPSGSESTKVYGEHVNIWGTLSDEVFNEEITNLRNDDDGFQAVSYRQIDPRSFNDTLLNAIAEGRAPDMVLLPSSELVRQRAKLLALSYNTVPLRDFKDAYIDGAEIFTRPDGVYAIPLAVDPIVLYWNRDMFASNGLVQAPTTWEYIVSTVVPSITRRDNNRNVQQSAIAFGEARNVQHAKEALLLLTMQSGSQMVTEANGQYQVNLNRSREANGLPPLEASVQFFLNFSNSNSQLYSWNRSEPPDRNAFISGDLGMYFGYGSEVGTIRSQNPNLNFDIAEAPQGASATIKRTYGEFYGFAILKASSNPQGAFAVANILAQPANAKVLSEQLGMAPASRVALAAGSDNAFRRVILNSALIARGWLDPNDTATDGIFQDMIEEISSGRKPLGVAVQDGEQNIRFAF